MKDRYRIVSSTRKGLTLYCIEKQIAYGMLDGYFIVVPLKEWKATWPGRRAWKLFETFDEAKIALEVIRAEEAPPPPFVIEYQDPE